MWSHLVLGTDLGKDVDPLQLEFRVAAAVPKVPVGSMPCVPEMTCVTARRRRRRRRRRSRKRRKSPRRRRRRKWERQRSETRKLFAPLSIPAN